MFKSIKNIAVLISAATASIIIGCSSGEYDQEQHKVDYVEKTLKIDTIRKVVVNDNDNIKDNTSKDVYTYIVQIGAFTVQENFDRFYAQARATLGSDVYYEFSNNLYKIRIGNYGNRADALKYLSYVISKGYSDAFVITKKK